jgi:ketosteroid isomerase-like protein
VRKFLAIAMLGMIVASVKASDHSDVMEVVRRWTDAFSQHSFTKHAAPCASDAVVIDDFQPHVWQGPAACSRWFMAFEAWASRSQVTGSVIRLGQIRHLEVAARFAYLVAPVTLSYSKGGTPTDSAGIITMTLHKAAAG